MTRLKLLRMQRGLTQCQMAELLEIHSSFLSRLEQGWFSRCPNETAILDKLRGYFGSDESFESLMKELEPDQSLTGN